MCVCEGRTRGVHTEARGGRKKTAWQDRGPAWGLHDRGQREIQAVRDGDRYLGCKINMASMATWGERKEF